MGGKSENNVVSDHLSSQSGQCALGFCSLGSPGLSCAWCSASSGLLAIYHVVWLVYPNYCSWKSEVISFFEHIGELFRFLDLQKMYRED